MPESYKISRIFVGVMMWLTWGIAIMAVVAFAAGRQFPLIPLTILGAGITHALCAGLLALFDIADAQRQSVALLSRSSAQGLRPISGAEGGPRTLTASDLERMERTRGS